MNPVKVKPRTRVGSWATFDRRYQPEIGPDGNGIFPWNHPAVRAADPRQVWTVVDVDGRLYVVPGLSTVNYMGRMVSKHRWSDVEESNPGYVY